MYVNVGTGCFASCICVGPAGARRQGDSFNLQGIIVKVGEVQHSRSKNVPFKDLGGRRSRVVDASITDIDFVKASRCHNVTLVLCCV